MLCSNLTYETDQSSSECAEGGGWRTHTLHVTPVNLSAHVVVAPGKSSMRQAVSSEWTSPVPFIPISCPLSAAQGPAFVLNQELLRIVCEGLHCNILHSHQLLVEFVVLVSVVHPVEILYVLHVGSGNA
jgi:hypothetical protein